MTTENQSPNREASTANSIAEAATAADSSRGRSNGIGAALREALRDGGTILAAILAFAILARLAYLAEFFRSNPLATGLYSDAKLYHDWATAIAGGDLLGPAEPYHHPPAYPYLVGLVYAVVGPHSHAIAVLQTLLGPLTLLLVYVLARRIAPRPFALGATGCLALYFPMVLFETRLLAESLTALASALALVHLSGAAGPLTRGRLLLGGLWLGLAAALRPNQMLAIALIAPAFVLLLRREVPFSRRLQDGAAIAFGALLAIAPFTARNWIHAGEPVLLCDTGGVNLFLAHQSQAGASFRVLDPAWGNVEAQARTARQIATIDLEEPDLTWREVSSHLARRAFDFAVAHPKFEIELLLRRARACLDSFEYEILYAPSAERAISGTSWLFPIPFAPFAMFVLAGIFAVLRCRDRRRDPLAIALVLFTAAQWITVLLFFQYSRFRVVSLVAIAPLAALGCAECVARIRARRVGVETLLALAGAVITFLPRTDEAREQLANQHVTIASAYRARGDVDAAKLALERAQEERPGLVRQVLESAELDIAGKRPDLAYEKLEAARQINPNDPILAIALARLVANFSAPPDLVRASILLESAITAAPGLIEAHEDLGRVLIRRDRDDASALLPAMRRATRLPAATGNLWAMYGRALRLAAKDREGARAALARALELDPANRGAQVELRELDAGK